MTKTNSTVPGSASGPTQSQLPAGEEGSLFSVQALSAKQAGWLGEVVVLRPVSFDVLTIFAIATALGIVAFFAVGTYTKRANVTGQLVPQQGLVKIYPSQPGVVAERRVLQGQRVRSGDVLYVISSDRENGNRGATQAMISALVNAKQNSLEREITQTRALQQMERDVLVRKVAALQAEIVSLGNLIEQEKHRVALAEDEESRYRDLVARELVSRDEYQQKQADLLDQRARLETSEHDRIAAHQDLVAAQSDLRSAVLKDDNSIEQIRRDIDSAGQELTESEEKRSVVITAPQAGVAAIVVAEVGQTVDPAKPVASIVPEGATLQAHLYAPSRATGFVRPGSPVVLRYQAYPYQKFGSFTGVVLDISHTPLSSEELTGLNNFAPKSDEPLYRITVALGSQNIRVEGHKQSLRVGMMLDADVLQDTRRLYEWVLEPLYAISGKLQSGSDAN